MTLLLQLNLGFAWGTVATPPYGLYVPVGWTMADRSPEWTMETRLPDWTMLERLPEWTMPKRKE